MRDFANIADRIHAMPLESDPWPHGILDDFLPSDLLAELLAKVPDYHGGNADMKKSKDIPASVLALMNDEAVLNAIRTRFEFAGGFNLIDVVYRRSKLQAHTDRQDKPWSGLIYLAGDPKGTELYGLDGKFVRSVEWKPNRLVCWANKLAKAQHAVPESNGRIVLVWWMLKNKNSK